LGGIIGFVKFKFKLDLSKLKNDFKEHLKIAKWLLPSGILKWTSVNLFLVASSFILGPISIGIIKLGQNITSIYNLFLLGLDNFVPIEAGEIFVKKGGNALVSYLKKITFYGLIFTIILGLFISFFSKQIIEIVYHNKYIEFHYILYWFSGFFIFMLLNSITQIFFVTIHKTKIVFKGYVLASMVSLVIFYPLISKFKIYGVLLGILISYIILIGIRLVNTKKIIDEKNYY
jgi:O-antigen/teichoic acid export membrane protein